MQYFLFISGQEITIILLLVVMLFGAKRIPEIARGLGQGMKYIRNATNEIKEEVSRSAEHNPDIKAAKDAIKDGKETIEELTDSVKRNTRI